MAKENNPVVIRFTDVTKEYKLYKSDKARFKAAYLAFLKTVAEKNGADCQIYCLYNTMNDTFKDAILEAVAEFGGEAKNVYTYQMTKAASGHPTIEENEKYTADLLKLMGLS